MWQSTLLKNVPESHPNSALHLPKDIFVKCLEVEWFKEIHAKMKRVVGGHLEGDDYFQEIFQPFRVPSDDIDVFFKRILKVISLFFAEHGDVEAAESKILFQSEGDALDAERKPMGFTSRDYEAAKQLFLESNSFREVFTKGVDSTMKLFGKQAKGNTTTVTHQYFSSRSNSNPTVQSAGQDDEEEEPKANFSGVPMHIRLRKQREAALKKNRKGS